MKENIDRMAVTVFKLTFFSTFYFRVVCSVLSPSEMIVPHSFVIVHIQFLFRSFGRSLPTMAAYVFRNMLSAFSSHFILFASAVPIGFTRLRNLPERLRRLAISMNFS